MKKGIMNSMASFLSALVSTQTVERVQKTPRLKKHVLNVNNQDVKVVVPFPSKGELEFEKEKRFLERGLTKFFYGDSYVWAINRKNADRKAKNLGLI